MTQDTFSFRKVYGSAAILAAITVGGLLSALFGDGIWDGLSWAALLIPLAVIAWKCSRNPEKDLLHRKRTLQ